MSTATDRREKVGDLAEDYFCLSCRKDDLSPTKTGKDKFGWDFFVEFPINRLPTVDFDQQPPSVKFFCQVKGTDDFSRRQVPMTVSNWLKLATTPEPAFVYIAEFQGADDPVNIWLCRIGAALKRARELQVAGKSDFHNHDMMFTADESEKLTLVSRSLRNRITNIVGISSTEYVRRKAATLTAIGYEKGRYQVNITTDLHAGELAEAFVGRGGIRVVESSISSFRFGIAVKKETFSSGTIKFTPVETSRCIVSVTTHSPPRKESFTASVFAANVKDVAGKSFLALRISLGTIIDIKISEHKTEFRLVIDPESAYLLSEVKSACDFVLACKRGAFVSFESGGTVFSEVEIEEEIHHGQELKAYAHRANMIREFSALGGFRDDFTIRLPDMFQPQSNFEWMYLALETEGQIESDVERREFTWDGTGMLASTIQFRANENLQVSFVYWIAEYHIADGKLKAKTRNAKIFDRFSVENSGTDILRSKYEAFKSFSRKSAKGVLMIKELFQD